MRRRRWMIVGFVLGYIWMFSRPARKSFWSVVRDVSGHTLVGAFEKGLRELIYGNVETPEEPETLFEYTKTSPMNRSVNLLTSHREEAERIIEHMSEELEKCGVVLVADLNAQINGKVNASENWGWKSLEGVMVSKGDRGWSLKFPPPRPM